MRITGYGFADTGVRHSVEPSIKELLAPGRGRARDSPYVELFVGAIAAALSDAKWWDREPFDGDNVGIAGSTIVGDGQAERWAQSARDGQPLARARDFAGIVHNSGIGRAAIMFGFRGPQILTMLGDVLRIATLQVENGRAEAMIICIGDELRSYSRAHLLAERRSNLGGYALVAERTGQDPPSRSWPLEELRVKSLAEYGSADVLSVWRTLHGIREAH